MVPSATPTPAAPVPLLKVSGLRRAYRRPRSSLWRAPPCVEALRGVDFSLQAGRSLGVVGESGSGKSTLARLVMGLDRPTAGSVEILGRDLARLGRRELRAARRGFQMVFQDPYASLDPRMTVERIVREPLAALADAPGSREAQRALARTALEQVGLRAPDLDKYPHEFSGGQRQRIAIARALITRPRLIVADEPVSALDVSVQAQVLNLLRELQQELGLSYLLISHDLAVVQHLCDEVVVLHEGLIVERGAPGRLFAAPEHPYTQALVASVIHI